MALVTSFEELRVYRLAFEAAMKIFELSKKWPAEEKFSLTNQIRRSSRSACGCIAEAWAKRRYPNHFVSKLTDSDGEVAETTNWLNFALACAYISQEEYDNLRAIYRKVTGGLTEMMAKPDKWCGPSQLVRETVSEYVVNEDGQ